MLQYHKKRKGFTLIEIVLAIAILGMMTALVSQPFIAFRHMVVMRSETENIAALLEKARVQTMASYQSSEYGIHFASSSMTLFKGAVYSGVDPENELYALDSAIVLSSVNLAGGGDDVIFNRLDGTTDEYGNLTLSLSSNASTTQTINVRPNGTIDINE